MAMTGLEIFKLLPKTNCGKCGVPTCLAFAMKVAAKQAALDQCPDVSAQAKEAIGAASAPPQKLVTIGTGDKALKIGNETVMFRHEERFHHPPGVAVLVSDTDDVAAKAARVKLLSFERVGEVIAVNVVAVECASGDAEKLKGAAQTLSAATGLPLVLIAGSASLLAPAAKALAASRPLLWERNGPSDELLKLAAETKLPIVVEGDLDKCDAAAQKARGAGIEELVLCPGEVDPVKALDFLTIARRAALKKTYRPFGYPTLARAWAREPFQQSLEACHYVAKYAGIVVITVDSPEYILPILTMRQDIYINPQVPVQVEPKLYTVGEPDDKAPLLVTTNFSLTFYSVLGEVEGSRVPARVLAVNTEGTSVLTAWAADKFGGAQVAEALKKSGALQMLAEPFRKPIIPGLVAVISGDLEDAAGCKVIIGPKEASGIPRFLKNEWRNLVG
jgi:acetyl-CoA decarbonylase/synthase complex subunit gamma